MSILNRIGRIIKANLKASLGNEFEKSIPRTQFSEAQTTNSRNQKTETASNLKDKNLEKAYAALEIPYGSDVSTAKTAWKKLVKKYHPDLFSNDSEKAKIAHAVTQGLNDALQTIQRSLNKTNSSS